MNIDFKELLEPSIQKVLFTLIINLAIWFLPFITYTLQAECVGCGTVRVYTSLFQLIFDSRFPITYIVGLIIAIILFSLTYLLVCFILSKYAKSRTESN